MSSDKSYVILLHIPEVVYAGKISKGLKLIQCCVHMKAHSYKVKKHEHGDLVTMCLSTVRCTCRH